jgi:hypothetical protein
VNSSSFGRAIVIAGALLLVSTSGEALADSALGKDGLQSLALQESQCEARISQLNNDIEVAARWSSIFTITGAIVAGCGAALAGFLSKESTRKTMAVVGALGAVVSVLPKALKDRESMTTVMMAADRHRTSGAKLLGELPFMEDPQLVRESAKYIASRFRECRSLEPSKQPPDMIAPSRPQAPPVMSAPVIADGSPAPRPSPPPQPSPPQPRREPEYAQPAPGSRSYQQQGQP